MAAAIIAEQLPEFGQVAMTRSEDVIRHRLLARIRHSGSQT